MIFKLHLKVRKVHFQHLKAVFERLDQYGLAIKPSKCTLGVSNIEFLSFKISAKGLSALPGRVDAITKIPKPTTITQLHRFLECIIFIADFSEILHIQLTAKLFEHLR